MEVCLYFAESRKIRVRYMELTSREPRTLLRTSSNANPEYTNWMGGGGVKRASSKILNRSLPVVHATCQSRLYDLRYHYLSIHLSTYHGNSAGEDGGGAFRCSSSVLVKSRLFVFTGRSINCFETYTKLFYIVQELMRSCEQSRTLTEIIRTPVPMWMLTPRGKHCRWHRREGGTKSLC